MASRSAAMPSPGGYWLAPAVIAWRAASSIAGGPSSSGKPWPRFTAPIRAASADISAKTVVANGCNLRTVMDTSCRADAESHYRPSGNAIPRLLARGVTYPTNRLVYALLGSNAEVYALHRRAAAGPAFLTNEEEYHHIRRSLHL